MYNRKKNFGVRSIFFLGALLIIACYTCMCKEKIKIKCNNTKSNAFIFAFYTSYTKYGEPDIIPTFSKSIKRILKFTESQ